MRQRIHSLANQWVTAAIAVGVVAMAHGQNPPSGGERAAGLGEYFQSRPSTRSPGGRRAEDRNDRSPRATRIPAAAPRIPAAPLPAAITTGIPTTRRTSFNEPVDLTGPDQPEMHWDLPTGKPAAQDVPSTPTPLPHGGPEVRAFHSPELHAPVADGSELPEPVQFGAAASKPFEVIDESGQLDVQMSRSKLLRMRVDVYRTAVVDPSICDIVQYTAREVAIIGKSHGATHVTFWFDDDQTGPMTYLVRVLPDESVRKDIENEYKVLEQMLAEHFPDSKVKLHPVADKLFVKGEARDSAEAAQILAIIRSHSGGGGNNANGGQNGSVNGGSAARVFAVGEAGDQQRPQIQVINMLRVPGVQQVALRVKIAELNRTAARGFGMDARARIEFKTDRAGLLVQSLLNATSGNAPALLANFDGTDINIGLRTLQQHGVLRLLSEPTLVTLSGQPATFVAGGEFAVPTLVANGGPNAITTDFRAFGAIISFLPTVVDKDRIRLQVAPEFSQINDSLSVGGTPGLNVRSVSTTVEMREGQTLAIAGLLDDNMKASSTTNVPILKSILGIRDVSRTETELLIIVTPELVHPMDPEETPPLPGFDVTEPTNHQFYWKNRLEGNPTWDHRSTVWPRLKRRYGAHGPAQTSGPFGHSDP